jgi:3-oxoacyl-[acyl-carrier-protein] synthase II
VNPPRASISGIGAVTPLGRELPIIQKKLQQPAAATTGPRRVDDELFADLGPRMRRADRFSRMAAVAASDCWKATAGDGVDRRRIGLIVSSGFGPHCRGFKFLDGILDCGDSDALPTDFSHSVHGAAAAYITEILELRGPSVTSTDFECGFEQAVLLAQCWLSDGVCDRVLVGAVEEIGEVLLHCASRMLDTEKFIPGEGAVFFMLGPPTEGGGTLLEATALPPKVDLLAIDSPPLPGDAGNQKLATIAGRTATFSPYFGHSPSSSAFGLLGAVLAAVDNAATFNRSCDPRAASLLTTRQ